MNCLFVSSNDELSIVLLAKDRKITVRTKEAILSDSVKKKILLVRMDKIGDLVLSLGVDQHPGLSSHDLHWLVPKGLEFVMDACSPARQYKTWAKDYSKESYKQLVDYLKSQNFDEVVFFQGAKWVLKALWAAKIPVRVGQRSNLLSYLFLNRSVKQKRSFDEKNEFQYNQDLIEQGLRLEAMSSLLPTVLAAQVDLPEELKSLDYHIVHAGMGGSALNWSQEKYISLIQLMINEGKKVLLTGTPGDMPYLDKIVDRFKSDKRVLNYIGKLSGPELLAVLENAKACMAPSTGVLHLAASLRTKVVGIYPPIKVQSKTRWGAYGDHVMNLAPEVNCPEQFRCRGEACQYYPCMESMSSEMLLGEINK